MPYIKKNQREETRDELECLIAVLDNTNSGELNYTITRILTDHLRYERIGYEELNRLIGILECVKLELYRRVAVPYEEQQCTQNGDVY